MFAIRPYHPSDLYALYRICLLTGDSGKDASAMYRDPELLGHVYTAPYVIYEPDLCFTLTLDSTPVGYVIAARDSQEFSRRCEQDWYPTLRARYPLPAEGDSSPDASMIRNIHRGYRPNPDLLAQYPAHLHIDLLPPAQGQGLGKQMIQTLAARLREIKVPGVHLGVGARNQNAIGFYAHVGFHQIQNYTTWIAYGMKFE